MQNVYYQVAFIMLKNNSDQKKINRKFMQLFTKCMYKHNYDIGSKMFTKSKRDLL